MILAAFTFNAGNGFSASVSVEDPSGHYKVGVGNLNSVAMTPLGVIVPSNGYVSGTLNEGMGVPDIIANLRVDQSWGYAGISGALHQVAGSYYSGASAAGSGIGCIGLPCTAFGHPSDKFGGAVAFGGNVYVPTGPGDTLGVNLVYSQGAVDFATKGNTWRLYKGKTAGFGWGFDGVSDNITPNCPVAGSCPSSIQLTRAWSINAGFEHHWSDQWKTSAYGGFAAVNYNQLAANLINQHLPSPPAGGTACGMPVEGIIQPPLGVGSGIGNSCNPSYSFFQVGSRTQYSPTPWLDLGVDATYTRLYSAYKGLGNPTALAVVNGVSLPANGAQPSACTASPIKTNGWCWPGRRSISFLGNNCCFLTRVNTGLAVATRKVAISGNLSQFYASRRADHAALHKSAIAPNASFDATRQFGRFRGRSGRRADTANRSLMTQSGHHGGFQFALQQTLGRYIRSFARAGRMLAPRHF